MRTEPFRIGVFDSGVGGLTVLHALLRHLPQVEYLYLGDTARLPYGSKSHETIARYAVGSARFLEEQGADMLVIACNTASAMALDEIRASVRLCVTGVIVPGAEAAEAVTRTGDVLVIGTAATVASHAYARTLATRGLRGFEKACPLFVPLVEEGWTDHPVTEQVARIYMDELLAAAEDAGFAPDTLVLGCTHYPLLAPLLRRLAPPSITIVDSAEATARAVVARLPGGAPAGRAGACSFYATDSVEKFRALGQRFLGRRIDGVELVDLGG